VAACNKGGRVRAGFTRYITKDMGKKLGSKSYIWNPQPLGKVKPASGGGRVRAGLQLLSEWFLRHLVSLGRSYSLLV